MDLEKTYKSLVKPVLVRGIFMMDLLGELNIDPLGYVKTLESPIGVYLRREVFGRESDSTLKKELAEKIVEGQSEDGSWDRMFVHTANSIWDLYLLGCDAEDTNVEKGLAWLKSVQKSEYHGLPGFFHAGNRKDPSTMRSTLYGEFGPGCTLFYETTYAAHLFHLFHLDEEVETTVDSCLKVWGDKGQYCSIWCTLNVLRILIEHPLSRDSRQVEKGLGVLAEHQTSTGAWKRMKQSYPFYHTFHALSRSRHPLAKQQLKTAFPSIAKRQNKDGSWGGKTQETTTYLVLGALGNIAKGA